MDKNTERQLIEINRQFYSQFAPSFSSTRGRVQPGVRRILQRMRPDSRVLDVGCGNGTLARALVSADFSGHYLGVDFSTELLDFAERLIGQPAHGSFRFYTLDLTSVPWALPENDDNFDCLVSFAVLHHVPNENLRKQVIQEFARRVKVGGMVAVSVWQWQNSNRLRDRVVPWETVEIDSAKVDQGDVLLDWRAAGSRGYRYVHTFSPASLSSLAGSAGFRVVETFDSDGAPGNLALYQVWQR